ncbi:MAG: hypothetical protein H7236_04875 [Gemmatimonadaceae bacterium]|nr:hypothetical protein [Caulobacter sp.]
MRRKRSRAVDVEEGESYYVSMTDMMVGVIFIFIIMLSYFAFEFRASTARLVGAKQPETAALLQTAGNLKSRNADLEVDYQARVLCVPEALLSDGDSGTPTERRCFSFAQPAQASAQAIATVDARRVLLDSLDADLRDAGAPVSGDPASGSLNFKAEKLFLPGSANLSPEGGKVAGQVAVTLARRLPCLGYGAPASAGCTPGGPRLMVVNVLSQTSLDVFTPEGQMAASLALQRAAVFHQALTGAQPLLAKLRNAPPEQGASQPLLRVASVGQSAEGASKAGDDQTVSIQFQMVP